MTIAGWRIYYGDGTTYSSNDGEWDSAPDQNVQVLIQYYEEKPASGNVYRDLHWGRDFYYQWGNTNDMSETTGKVLYGKYMPTEEEFDVIAAIAMKDYVL